MALGRVRVRGVFCSIAPTALLKLRCTKADSTLDRGDASSVTDWRWVLVCTPQLRDVEARIAFDARSRTVRGTRSASEARARVAT